jgi:hypothetical protein
MSVNNKFTIARGSRRITKKSEVYIYERSLKQYLMTKADDIKVFTNNILHKECLSFEVVIYVPKNLFFNKKGLINLTCLDVSNAIKILEDCIYKELGINDAMNVFISGEKRPFSGDDFITLINISKRPLPVCDPLDSLGKLFTN